MAKVAEHYASRDTLDIIGQWACDELPYSTRDKWDRFGFVGMFAEFVCSCTGGDILEIGSGESSIYLTRVAKKYNRRIIYCDVGGGKLTNPMTIPGYLTDESEMDYIKEGKGGEWKKRALAFEGRSDTLFKEFQVPKLAFTFIDGDHLYDQAARDFRNAMTVTTENGYVLLHDTYPPGEDWTTENTCGEVWRLRKEIEGNKRYDVLTIPKGTAIGVGLTIVRKKPLTSRTFQDG